MRIFVRRKPADRRTLNEQSITDITLMRSVAAFVTSSRISRSPSHTGATAFR